MTSALVIGGGPAGLMAADVLSRAGQPVVVADAMPTVGRKFLMAGKSGLNLTKHEPIDQFVKAYGARPAALDAALAAFGPAEVVEWTEGLGQEVFTGSTGRVFPTVMKASPLLRQWLARLSDQGVEVRTRWRFRGMTEGGALFSTPTGDVSVQSSATILAMGGASWARLGSDGAWAKQFPNQTAPFKPANMGFEVSWSAHMQPHLGSAIKGCRLSAGDMHSRGEFVLSERGIEGGGIYEVAAEMRDGATLVIDLLPNLPAEEIARRVLAAGRKTSRANILRKSLGLPAAKRALFNEFWDRSSPLEKAIKALELSNLTPRPIDEAISTAGGISFDALTGDLMLRDMPGVFCAGEMLDWEAPTGGYLITGCLATGRHAALGALRYIQA